MCFFDAKGRRSWLGEWSEMYVKRSWMHTSKYRANGFLLKMHKQLTIFISHAQDNKKKEIERKLFSALLLCFCFRSNRWRRNNCKVHIFFHCSMKREFLHSKVHAQHRHFVKSEKLCSFMLYLIRHTAASFTLIAL